MIACGLYLPESTTLSARQAEDARLRPVWSRVCVWSLGSLENASGCDGVTVRDATVLLLPMVDAS